VVECDLFFTIFYFSGKSLSQKPVDASLDPTNSAGGCDAEVKLQQRSTNAFKSG
jgi:hypothetical protein